MLAAGDHRHGLRLSDSTLTPTPLRMHTAARQCANLHRQPIGECAKLFAQVSRLSTRFVRVAKRWRKSVEKIMTNRAPMKAAEQARRIVDLWQERPRWQRTADHLLRFYGWLLEHEPAVIPAGPGSILKVRYDPRGPPDLPGRIPHRLLPDSIIPGVDSQCRRLTCECRGLPLRAIGNTLRKPGAVEYRHGTRPAQLHHSGKGDATGSDNVGVVAAIAAVADVRRQTIAAHTCVGSP